jgi:hypothetical protein
MVFYYGTDNETQGDWTHAFGSPIGVYGSYAHILPNPLPMGLQIPVGPYEYPVGQYTYTSFGWTSTQIAGIPYGALNPPYLDEYVSQTPKINYTLTGTLYNMPGIGWIQYPVFEWTWENNFNSTDPRAALFQVCSDGGRRLTCWDDGGERGFPSNGYFNITLTFPEGCFMLSLYAYDEERTVRDNQMIYITSTNGTVLASGMMQGTDFDEGVYLNFLVDGPTTIIVQVQSSPQSTNALLSGIFVDKLKTTCKSRDTDDICYWKTTACYYGCKCWCGCWYGGWYGGWYGYRYTQTADQYLDFVSDRCPAVFGGLTSIKDACNILNAYRTSTLAAAKAQLLALLLNVASGKAFENDVVMPYLYSQLKNKYPSLSPTDYPLTVGQTIDMSCKNIASMTNLKFTADMCATLNNGYQATILMHT